MDNEKRPKRYVELKNKISKIPTLFKQGKSDKYIAEKHLKISYATLKNWKKKYPEFLALFKQAVKAKKKAVTVGRKSKCPTDKKTLDRLNRYIMDGHNMETIAKYENVSLSSVYLWLENNKVFSESLHASKKVKKEQHNISLDKLSLGYFKEIEETKFYQGDFFTKRHTVWIPPDMKAVDLWYKLNDRERYYNIKDDSFEGDAGGFEWTDFELDNV